MPLRPPSPASPLPPLTTVLTTERLVLRPPRPTDVPILRAHLRRSAEHLRPFSPAARDKEDPTSLTYLSRLIVRQRREWRRGQGFSFLAFAPPSDDTLVARVTLSRLARGSLQEGHLGYAVDVDHVEHGYATEAVRSVVTFAFRDLALHRLQAAVMPSNIRSVRVLEKLGFRQEGLALRYLFIADRWEDHLLFAKTAEEE